MKRELPKIVFDNEPKTESPKTEFNITYEIKTENVGGNETNKILENKVENRKVTRVNDLIIENEIKKAPHPPSLPVPKMPVLPPHPPQLPVPQKLSFATKLKLKQLNHNKNVNDVNKKKRKGYFLFIIVFCILGIVCLGLGLFFKSQTDERYKNAIYSFEKGDSKLIEQFCGANSNYGDCKNIQKYIEAQVLFNSNNLLDAKEIFENLNDFYDSKKYLLYIDALDELNNYNIDKSLFYFEKITDLTNVQYYIDYINLIKSINNSENNDVLNVLDVLDDHIDVSLVKNYLEAESLYNDGDYKKAIELLEKSSNVLNKAKMLFIDSKYNYAKIAQSEGYISTAYAYLSSIGDYKDSKVILKSPIYNVINNWYYSYSNQADHASISLAFYESSDTCFHEIKNGSLIGLSTDNVENTYNYKILNNTLYFENDEGEFVAIYQIRKYSSDELVLQVNQNKSITLKKV